MGPGPSSPLWWAVNNWSGGLVRSSWVLKPFVKASWEKWHLGLLAPYPLHLGPRWSKMTGLVSLLWPSSRGSFKEWNVPPPQNPRFSVLMNYAFRLWVWLFCCSIVQSCPALCDPMVCSTPGSPVLHHLLDLAQTHVHWVADAIQPSHPLMTPFSFCSQSFPASGSFSMSQLFISGGQGIGVSASASVLPMNI